MLQYIKILVNEGPLKLAPKLAPKGPLRVVLGARKGISQGRLRGGPRALIDKYSPHDVDG